MQTRVHVSDETSVCAQRDGFSGFRLVAQSFGAGSSQRVGTNRTIVYFYPSVVGVSLSS